VRGPWPQKLLLYLALSSTSNSQTYGAKSENLYPPTLSVKQSYGIRVIAYWDRLGLRPPLRIPGCQVQGRGLGVSRGIPDLPCTP